MAKRNQRDDSNPYWISFSDLMSGLLVVFILAAVALIIEVTESAQKIESDILAAERARHDILFEIRDRLIKHNIEVLVADNETVLRIPEETLSFDSDSFTLPASESAQLSIRLIGQVLYEAITSPFDSRSEDKRLRFELLDTVFIEGHTDSQPSTRVKGNWGLSTYRAISLWEFWEDSLMVDPPFSELKNSSDRRLFSVSGYAATRRANEEEITPDDRRENRRIDIRITVKRPRSKEMEKYLSR